MITTPTLPETPRERDERLHAAWLKASGIAKQKLLGELLDALQGPINIGVNAFRGAPLPFVTVELEAKRNAASALNDWDRTRGVTLANYITTRVKQGLSRYVGTYQNVARLPEAQLQKIGPLREAMSDLSSRFGREPSTAELADHMGVPLKHVTRLRKNLRADLISEAGGLDNLEAYESDPAVEKAMMVYYQLTRQEQQVFDYSLGAHGLPRLKPGEIAGKLGISAARVSALKQSVAEKIKPYIEGV